MNLVQNLITFCNSINIQTWNILCSKHCITFHPLLSLLLLHLQASQKSLHLSVSQRSEHCHSTIVPSLYITSLQREAALEAINRCPKEERICCDGSTPTIDGDFSTPPCADGSKPKCSEDDCWLSWWVNSEYLSQFINKQFGYNQYKLFDC